MCFDGMHLLKRKFSSTRGTSVRSSQRTDEVGTIRCTAQAERYTVSGPFHGNSWIHGERTSSMPRGSRFLRWFEALALAHEAKSGLPSAMNKMSQAFGSAAAWNGAQIAPSLGAPAFYWQSFTPPSSSRCTLQY